MCPKGQDERRAREEMRRKGLEVRILPLISCWCVTGEDSVTRCVPRLLRPWE